MPRTNASDRQPKNKKHDALDWANFWVLVATLLAVAWYACVSYRQLQVSRQTLITDQRPWVSLEDVKISSPLTHDAAGWKNGVRWHITLTYKLKNYGKTPATHVTFWAHIVPIVTHYQDDAGKLHGTFIRDELDAACDWTEFATEYGIDTGQLIFPGKDWPSKTFEVQGDEKIFEEAKGSKTEYSGTFLIPICITYRSPYGNTHSFVQILTNAPPEGDVDAILGNDQYRTAEGYRLGKKSGIAISLDGETINQNGLVLGEPGFQATYIK